MPLFGRKANTELNFSLAPPTKKALLLNQFVSPELIMFSKFIIISTQVDEYLILIKNTRYKQKKHENHFSFIIYLAAKLVRTINILHLQTNKAKRLSRKQKIKTTAKNRNIQNVKFSNGIV